MYAYKTLENTDIQTLYQTFTEAFSDYQVNIELPLEAFETMLKRRGFAPDCSVGAFTVSGNELVGFILNGLRDWRGKLTAYDLGTGVVPSRRNQGISRHMFRGVLEMMTQNNVEQYLLEVLQENKAAYKLYKSQGLLIARSYSCFRLNGCGYVPKPLSHRVEYLPEIEENEWAKLKGFWEFDPSWQNSVDSVRAVQGEFVYAAIRIEDNIVGYGVVGKRTGDVPQIAVHKEYRCRGIATDIAAALLEKTAAGALSVLNVDDNSEGMKRFLSAVGFELTVSQYEMILKRG